MTISITGEGFTPNAMWSAYMGSITLFEGGSVSAEGYLLGGNNIMILHGLAVGNYSIQVWDSEDHFEPCAQFTVTYNTSLTMTPANAPNKYNVTIKGQGFSYSEMGETDLTFTIYNITQSGSIDHVWNMDVKENCPECEKAKVNSSGMFDAYWFVPDAIRLGTYYINATDANGYLGQAMFRVTEPHITAVPQKTMYKTGEAITFQIEHSLNCEPINGSVIQISDPKEEVIFTSDPLYANKWTKTGLWYTLPSSAQTINGNPIQLPENATTGTWSYKWIGTDDVNFSSGFFTVIPKDTPIGSLKLTVKDQNGNPLPEVTVSSTKQPNGQTALNGITDNQGVIIFPDLLIGNYTFQASKNSYSLNIAQGTVSKDTQTNLTIILQPQSTGGGIPGYPTLSILTGIIISAIVLFLKMKSKQMPITKHFIKY